MEIESRQAAEVIRVKEEQLEETKESEMSSLAQNKDGDTAMPECQQDKDNLFLQKPGSLSKLSKLLEVAKMAQDLNINIRKSHPAASYPSYPTSQSVTAQQGLIDKADTSVPSLLSAAQLKSSHWMTRSPQSVFHYDQLSKMLTEKSNQWFSLLPRSPCDESMVTYGSSPSASSSSPQPIRTKSPSYLCPNPLAAASYNATAGINNMQSPILQVGGLQ